MELIVQKSILKRNKFKEKIDILEPSKIPKILVQKKRRHCIIDNTILSTKTHRRKNIKVLHKRPIVPKENEQNVSKDEVPEAFDMIKESQACNERVSQITESSPLKTSQNKNNTTSVAINKSKVTLKDATALLCYKNRYKYSLTREVKMLKTQNKLFNGEHEEAELKDTSESYKTLNVRRTKQSKDMLNIKLHNEKEIENGTNRNDQANQINKTIRKSLRLQTIDEQEKITKKNKIVDNKERLCETDPFAVRFNLRNEISVNEQNNICTDESDKEDFTKLIFQAKSALSQEKDSGLRKVKGILRQSKRLSVNKKNIQKLSKDSALIAFTDDNKAALKSKSVYRKRKSNKMVTSAMQSADENTVKEKGMRISEDIELMQPVNTDEPIEAEIQSSNTKLGEVEKCLPIFKSQDAITFEPDVTKSPIGTRMVIEISSNEKVVQLDCFANYASMHSNFEPVARSNGNILFSKGLNIPMAGISSGIFQINVNSYKEMQTPKRHHLIFCIMTGTVLITIYDTSKRITTGDHFFVPCNVSYDIRNVGMQRAVLSFFKVTKGCFDLDGST